MPLTGVGDSVRGSAFVGNMVPAGEIPCQKQNMSYLSRADFEHLQVEYEIAGNASGE